MRNALLLLAITLLALVLRVVHLDSSPPGFFIDEASVGINAQGIATMGRDQFGTAWPALFKALGDWKHPLIVYGAAASVKLLGLSIFSVRLPAALFGCATVMLIALLARELWPDKRNRYTGPVAALVLALMPWHVQYSRMAFESITFGATMVLASWLFLVAHRRGGAFSWSLAGAAFGLALYSYTPAKLLVPAFVCALFAAQTLANQRAEVAVRRAPDAPGAAWLVGAMVLVAVPMLVTQAQHFAEIQGRFNSVSVLREPAPLRAAATSYFAHLDPRFLFIDGDHNPRHGWRHWGELLVVTAPFALAGLLLALRRRSASDLFVIAWLLLYPLGGATTSEGIPHASRSFLAAPLFALLTAYGFIGVVGRLRNVRTQRAVVLVSALLFTVNAAAALRWYFVKYPAYAALAWSAGFEDIVRTLEADRARFSAAHVAAGNWIAPEHLQVFNGFDPSGPNGWKLDPYYQWSFDGDTAHALASLQPSDGLIARLDQLPGVQPELQAADPTGTVRWGVFRGTASR